VTYEVLLFVWDGSERCHSVTDRRIVGGKRAGELCARHLLRSHTVVTTNGCYHRDTRHAAFVLVSEPGKPLTKPVASYDAPVDIVPSVGELGWTP
jgi:hypothetical protein